MTCGRVASGMSLLGGGGGGEAIRTNGDASTVAAVALRRKGDDDPRLALSPGRVCGLRSGPSPGSDGLAACTLDRPVVYANRFGPPIDGVSLALEAQLGPWSPVRGRTPWFFTYLWNRSNERVTVCIYPFYYDLSVRDAAGREQNDVAGAPTGIDLGTAVRRDWGTLDPGAMVSVPSYFARPDHRGLPAGDYTARVSVETEHFDIPQKPAHRERRTGAPQPLATGEVQVRTGTHWSARTPPSPCSSRCRRPSSEVRGEDMR